MFKYIIDVLNSGEYQTANVYVRSISANAKLPEYMSSFPSIRSLWTTVIPIS